MRAVSGDDPRLDTLQRAFEVDFKLTGHRRDVKALQSATQFHLEAFPQTLPLLRQPAQRPGGGSAAQFGCQGSEFGMVRGMAKQRPGFLADPPSSPHRTLGTPSQLQPHGLPGSRFHDQWQPHRLGGDLEQAFLAIRLPGKDARMIRQRLEKGVQTVTPKRDGQALRLLDPLPRQPGREG